MILGALDVAESFWWHVLLFCNVVSNGGFIPFGMVKFHDAYLAAMTWFGRGAFEDKALQATYVGK